MAEREAALRAELLHLLELAYPEPGVLRAFVAEHWPSFAASWTIDPSSRPDNTSGHAPRGEPRALSISEFVREALLRRAEALLASGEALAEPTHRLLAAPRRLGEIVVDEAVRSRSVHRLLDAVGEDCPHLIAEVTAIRERFAMREPAAVARRVELGVDQGGFFEAGDEPPTRSGQGGAGGGAPVVRRRPPTVPAPAAPPAVRVPDLMVRKGDPLEVLGTSRVKLAFPSAEETFGLPVALSGAQARGQGARDIDLVTAPPLEPGALEEPEAGAPSSAAPAGAAREPGAPVRPQIVSLGFSNQLLPDTPIIAHTFAVDEEYVLWLEIAPEYAPGSAPGAEPLRGLRQHDEIDVILFEFPDQLALTAQRHGRIRIDGDKNPVVQQAWAPGGLASPVTLYFPVRTPKRPGRASLRCNLYCRGLLLQSHLVTVEVTARVQERRDAVARKVDYNLTASLDTARLGPESACSFSLLLNADSDGTHSFRFVSSTGGVPEQIDDGHIEGSRLAKLVDYAREALRFFAWGTSQPWDPARDHYLLDTPDATHLELAWVRLARRGANLWMAMSEAFGALGPAALRLRDKLRAPGVLQLALKESPDSVFPAALVYDYPLDIGRTDVKLCPTAFEAIRAGKELAQEPCFCGRCPAYDERNVVCPGGFWGFRHELGLPIHLPRGEVAATIPRGAAVRAFAAVSMDDAFVQREDHLRDLEKLVPGGLEVLRDRQSCLTRLEEPRQLVYFYCHGGLTEESETPYLLVGANDSDRLFAQSLFDAGVFWPDTLRPLVVVNGCHTTATSPDEMFSMLSAFAAHGNAAGVIGTEITNFEPVAVTFGESLITGFLSGDPLGKAVRKARLELLRGGNPLGLMYIPFALPSLRLV